MLAHLISWLCPVRRASTSQETRAAQRLRYEVYVNELRKNNLSSAALSEGMVADPEDERAHTALFYAGPASAPSGTLRVDVYAPGSAPPALRARYGLDAFPEFERETIAELGRFVVSRTRRRSLTAMSLGIGAYSFIVGAGARFAFAYAAPGLVRSYRRFGFRPYCAPLVSTPDGTRVPLISLAADSAYLRRYGSPLGSLAQRAFKRQQGQRDAAMLGDRISAAAAAVDIRKERVAAALEKLYAIDSPVVRGVPKRAIARLRDYAAVLRLRAGEHFLRAGLQDRELYVVIDGSLTVSRQGIPVAHVGPGDTLGEVALFAAGGLRSADVHANSPCELVMLGRRFIEDPCAKDPAMAARLVRNMAGVMAERMTSSLQHLETALKASQAQKSG